MKVILDNECREYRQGWNANNRGDSFLSNPYSCLAFDGELYRLWQKGFDDNFTEWNKPNIDLPKSFSDQLIKESFSIVDQEPAF